MKRTISLFLSLLMLLSVIVIPVGAASNGSASLSSTSGKVGDTVYLTVSLSGFGNANTIGVNIDAPEGLSFNAEKSKWLPEVEALPDLNATEGAWAVADAQNINGSILTLAYDVETFQSIYTVSVTVKVKNNNETLGTVSASGTVTVTNPLTKLTISDDKLSLNLSDGPASATLTASATPSNTTDSIVWSTSDSKVASVRDGVVTAHDIGTATITVRGGSLSASCKVTVICGHSFDDWRTVKEPSETAEGLQRRECKFCSHYEQRTLPALELQPPVVKATNKASNGAPQLSWEAVPGAVKYEIYRSTSKSGTYSKLSTTSGTSLTNTSTTVGKTYYYKVRSVDANGKKSDFSAIVSRARDLPQPVLTVSNKASTGKITLSWKAIDGALEYKVYRATSEDGDYSLLKTTANTSLTNTSVSVGQTYYYKVKAIHSKSAANSADSIVKSGTCLLPQPTDVTISSQSSTGKPFVSWGAVTDAEAYDVYRATSKSGTYSKIVSTGETSLIDSDATVGKTYYYKIKAVPENADAASADSAVVYRTCDLARPVVNTSNKASTGKILISWEAVDGAAKYEIYRATSKSGTYSKLSTTTGTSLTNTSTTAGKAYYYKVKAIHSNSSANSAYSSVVSRTCDLAQPSVTVTLNSKDKPVLSWKKIDGAVKYEVYRSTDGDNYSLLKSTTGLKLTNSSAESGVTYYYKVKAIHSKSAANSAYSSVDSITCP